MSFEEELPVCLKYHDASESIDVGVSYFLFNEYGPHSLPSFERIGVS